MAKVRVQELVSSTNYLSEEKIKSVLSKYKTIRRYGYILHDKDVYTEADGIENSNYITGAPVPAHWHVLMEFSRANDSMDVANWFGVPENFIDFKRGTNAFLEAFEYLTHEKEEQQELGKYFYPDAEVIANFDFRSAIEQHYNDFVDETEDESVLKPKQKLRYDVLYNGKTLRQCEREYPILYMNDIDRLKKLRMEYISNQRVPNTRLNFYITGQGGSGKGLMSKAIARSLFPEYLDDEDIFFEVGAKGAAFEGYAGQPVLIWNDRRANELLKELGGRGNVFNIFDTHPGKQKQNIKYGSINLCNKVNIVNSVQPSMEFLDGIAGEYTDRDGILHEVEDKKQSYRRFPFVIDIHEESFDFYVNSGFINRTSQYDNYVVQENILGNMQRIVERCGTNNTLAKDIQAQMVRPITYVYNSVMELVEKEEIDAFTIIKEFADYGKQLTQNKVLENEEKADFPINEENDFIN